VALQKATLSWIGDFGVLPAIARLLLY